MRKVLRAVFAAFWRWVDPYLNRIFAINRHAGINRRRFRDLVFFIAFAIVFWMQRETFTNLWWWRGVGEKVNSIGHNYPSFVRAFAFAVVVVWNYTIHNIIPALIKAKSLVVLILAFFPYEFAKYFAARYIEDVHELSLLFWEREAGQEANPRPSVKALRDGLKTAEDFLIEAALAWKYGRVQERKRFPCALLFRLRLLLCPTEQECFNWAKRRVYEPQQPLTLKYVLKYLWDWLVRGKPIGCPHILAIVDGEAKDPYSPLLWIGGPGYVFISADNAVLFELKDGSWRVLEPTIKRLHLIEGFERVRRIVSLREHTSTFNISARTRDGIRITARDVRVLYRIYRGGRPSTPARPYPFVPQAVRSLVLEERAVPVSNRWGRLSSSVMVANSLANMTRSEFSRFIRSQTLVQLLASVFPPDMEMLREMYREIAEELVAEAQVPPLQGMLPLPTPPEFFPHNAIVEKFDAMVNGPEGEVARRRGVGLHWIGVGTFDPPIERIPQRHMEAWRISVENMMRQAPVVLRTLERQRWASTILHNVERAVRAFHETAEKVGTRRAVFALLQEYQRIALAAGLEIILAARTIDKYGSDDDGELGNP